MEALEDGALGSNMGVGPGFITPHQELSPGFPHLEINGTDGTQVSSDCRG